MNLLSSFVEIFSQIVGSLSESLGVYYQIILNGIGVLAVIIKFIEYQRKKRSANIILGTAAAFCWVLYFLMQANLASALSCLLIIIANLVFLQRGKHKWAESFVWLFIFIAIQTVFGIISFKSALDLFAIFAGLLSITSYFVKNRTIYRILALVSALCWVTNSCINFYLIALVSDITATVSVTIALIRFNLLKKPEKLEDN